VKNKWNEINGRNNDKCNLCNEEKEASIMYVIMKNINTMALIINKKWQLVISMKSWKRKLMKENEEMKENEKKKYEKI